MTWTIVGHCEGESGQDILQGKECQEVPEYAIDSATPRVHLDTSFLLYSIFSKNQITVP